MGKQKLVPNDFDFDAALNESKSNPDAARITPRLIGELMISPAIDDEEGFGDRISLYSSKDGKYDVWGKRLFDMIKKENPQLAIAIVKLAGEWRGSLPEGKQIGNDKLTQTLSELEYSPWIDNDSDGRIGLILLIEWGRFVLTDKEVYENVQEQIKEFLEYVEEEEGSRALCDHGLWDEEDEFKDAARLFINTKWEDVPQHGHPEPNDEMYDLSGLNYPEQPDDVDDDDFEPYGEPEEDDFSATSGILGGGGSRLANDILGKLAASGAQIVGVGPGSSMTIGVGPGGISMPNIDNIESKNSKSGAFDKQKNWKDIPDFDPSHAARPKKKTDDDDDFDFDEDAFKQDLKSLLGDDDD